MLRDMIGQRVLARIPDLAAPKPTAAAPAQLTSAPTAPAATAAAPKVAPTVTRHKPAWDPSLLRVPRLSPRGKLILGACVLVAVVWFVRGRFDGESTPVQDSAPVDFPTVLTVVPLEEPPNVTSGSKDSPTIAAPQNTSPQRETIRQAELPRHDPTPKPQPTAQDPAAQGPVVGVAAVAPRQSVAPPSTQPVPPWQEPAAAPQASGRQELTGPFNGPAPVDRAKATPPKMSPLWPQDDRRPQATQPSIPQIQHNQFVNPQPAVRRPPDSADAQIEWAAPFAPGREAGRESSRTSDRRGDLAPGRYDGSF
jgi:hypothetical protein